MSNGIHDGHRERLKARFLEHGLESFEPHQVLELLLFYSIPRRDTNPLAHELLKTFGTLPAVLDADVRDLCRVKGISEHSATLLRLCGQLLKRYHHEKLNKCTTFSTVEEIGEYLYPQFVNESVEKTIMLSFNNRWDLLGCDVLSTGTVSCTDARLREIIANALRHQATGVVLAHNHPAGFAVPSTQDLNTTRDINKALKMVDIDLLDHMVFAREDYISMRQSPTFAALFSDMATRRNR